MAGALASAPAFDLLLAIRGCVAWIGRLRSGCFSERCDGTAGGGMPAGLVARAFALTLPPTGGYNEGVESVYP